MLIVETDGEKGLIDGLNARHRQGRYNLTGILAVDLLQMQKIAIFDSPSSCKGGGSDNSLRAEHAVGRLRCGGIAAYKSSIRTRPTRRWRCHRSRQHHEPWMACLPLGCCRRRTVT